MSIVRPRISTFFSLSGPFKKKSNFEYFLLHRVSETTFFDQLPLVSAGPHIDDPRQLFMLNLNVEVT